MNLPERVWLGWDGPVLERAARWITDSYTTEREVRAGRALVVLPVARAGRWLEGMLVDLAADRGLVLEPPGLVPVAHLASQISSDSIASDGARVAAWRSALDSESEARRVITADNALWAWARSLSRASDALVASGARFRDALVLASGMDDDDRVRLEACARLEQVYLGVLRSEGHVDTPSHSSCANRDMWDQIVLAGLPEFSRQQREMVGAAGVPVNALIAAPQSLGERFDEWGMPIPDRWVDALLPLSCEQIRFTDEPQDQAQAVWECVASLGGSIGARDVVVGALDPTNTGAVTRCAEAHGLDTRDAAGSPMRLTPLGALLERISSFVDSPSFESFGGLVRHPDIERAIGSSWWIKAIDRYAQKSQRTEFKLSETAWNGASASERRALEFVVPRVAGILAPLLSEGPATLGSWCDRTLDSLTRLYEGRTFDPQKPGDRPRRIGLERVLSIAVSLHASRLECEVAEALQHLAELLTRFAIPDEADADTVELLGWLELATDPAPVCIVCDANEGVLPSRIGLDPVLPVFIRERLGLPTDVHRAGRDAYLLALLASSKEHCTVISCARTGTGDPRPPSRFLFRASDESVLARLSRASSGHRDPMRKAALEDPARLVRSRNGFSPQPTPRAEPPEEWPVTRFRVYLDSPYAFYLQTVLRRRELRAAAGELDAGAFGDLLHDALARFGRDEEAREWTDDEAVSSALGRHLDNAARALFGTSRPVSVEVQLEQALLRLRMFAPIQAAWARDGWQIKHVEWAPEDGAMLDVPGQSDAKLVGRIDRIDVNERTGAVAIIDYKSGKHTKTPDASHVIDGAWRDLQLPLYRRLAAGLGAGESPTLAYALLPPHGASTRFSVAKWVGVDLDDAEDMARVVIRRVRAGDHFDLEPRPIRDGIVGALGGFGLLDTGSPDEGDA